MEITVKDVVITLVKGDITDLAVDAIVNPANSDLILGGGVAGAVRRRGGPSIQEECSAIGNTPVGTAVITGAGDLPAKHVIHAVGPVMGSGDENRKLADAVRNALEIAEANNVRSIAFPAISTGIFGFPGPQCARILFSTVIAYLKSGSRFDRIIFCLFDNDMYSIFETEASRLAEE
ncbi:macro domain-containing protein [bacterium]|nr:macro domain-containing protein [candidate division CSSED10-310 bacterium]